LEVSPSACTLFINKHTLDTVFVWSKLHPGLHPGLHSAISITLSAFNQVVQASYPALAEKSAMNTRIRGDGIVF